METWRTSCRSKTRQDKTRRGIDVHTSDERDEKESRRHGIENVSSSVWFGSVPKHR
jgi:hypothetical protein